jgi:hypothetical protein
MKYYKNWFLNIYDTVISINIPEEYMVGRK